MLTKKRYIEKIIHFGDSQIFQGATTYTALIFLDKSGSDEFRFLKVENLLEWHDSNYADGELIPSSSLTDNAWNFSIGLNSKLLNKLSQMPIKMFDITSKIAQGIRTSANEIYVLDVIPDRNSTNDKIVEVKSKLWNRTFEIEKNVTSSFLQGREIKSYRILSSGKVVIIPYTSANGQMKLLSKKEMKDKYPKTYSYLLENKK